jgi:hypothetical protein
LLHRVLLRAVLGAHAAFRSRTINEKGGTVTPLGPGIVTTVVGNVVSSILIAAASLAIGVAVGHARHVDDGTVVSARIDGVASRNGGARLCQEIRAHGVAVPNHLPHDFQLRLAISDHGLWYVDEDPVVVTHGKWAQNEILGADEGDIGQDFVISVLLGKQQDFDLWAGDGKPEEEGNKGKPEDAGIFVLADRGITRAC